MLVTSHIVGDIDIRGRRLPAALARLSLADYRDPHTGRTLSAQHYEAIRKAQALDDGTLTEDDLDGETAGDVWDEAWEVLENAEGLSRQDSNGAEWQIGRNGSDDLIIYDETAATAVQHNTVQICRTCRELIHGGEGDADQEQRRAEALEAVGIDDSEAWSLQELDEASAYLIGGIFGDAPGAMIEDECGGCGTFAPLEAYIRANDAARDYDELCRPNAAGTDSAIR